jgi:SHS2 domain-containing protein
MGGQYPGRQPKTGWQHFEHVADVGVRGFGTSMAEAFEQAALALTAVISSLDTVQRRETVTIDCEAPNAEFLLADWLNAIVFEMATRHLLFSAFKVDIHENHLSGKAHGEAIDTARHQPAAEVKGATLSELLVTQTPDGHWLAQCILDV